MRSERIASAVGLVARGCLQVPSHCNHGGRDALTRHVHGSCMSYLAFTTDLSDEIGRMRAQSLAPGVDLFAQAHERVFARWLAAGRHEALVRYVVENFDGAEGGEAWMRLLADDLAANNHPDLLRKLYEPVLRRR